MIIAYQRYIHHQAVSADSSPRTLHETSRLNIEEWEVQAITKHTVIPGSLAHILGTGRQKNPKLWDATLVMANKNIWRTR